MINPLPRLGLNDDGTRWFDQPAMLLERIELKLAVYDTQVRAEMWQRKGAPGESGHVVWQHRSDIPHDTDSATLMGTHYLGTTASYLALKGWPGLLF